MERGHEEAIAWTLVILMVVAALGKKKRQITMSDFPLIGVVCMDALDALACSRG